MKSLYHFLKRNFELNQHETLSVLFGLAFLILIAAFSWFFDRWTNQQQAAIILAPYSQPDSALQALNTKKRELQYARVKGYAESKLHLFNPNTATLAELTENQFPEFLAIRLIKFREAGKKFRFKEDLSSIYGFSPHLYEKLEPYIELPSKGEQVLASSFSEVVQPTEKPKFERPKPAYTEKVIEPFDINLATAEELIQIRGIGEGFSNRILKYRNNLGGFYSLDQLKNTYGLPDSTLLELKKHVFIKSAPNKIKINSVTLENWPSPLLKSYQKRAIIAYRNQHGNYKNAEDLKKVKVLKDVNFDSLLPYLDFSP